MTLKIFIFGFIVMISSQCWERFYEGKSYEGSFCEKMYWIQGWLGGIIMMSSVFFLEGK